MNGTTSILIFLAAAAAATHAGPANPNLPLDRNFTQRNPVPDLLEGEYRRQITSGGPLSFVFPRPCISSLDSSSVCADAFHLAYRDPQRDQDIGLAFQGAEDWRYVGDNVTATEAGFQTSGHKGIASFSLDARVFTENAGRDWVSYDGENVDVQNEAVTGSSSYLSYSRYRGEMSLDLPFGRLAAGRDGAHWGPALMGSLVFNQDGIPFNQYTFTTHLGPVTVHTLHGDLRAAGAESQSPEKSMYAHRYELRLGDNVLIGLSEQLIMVGLDKPYLFVPVFPLFIAKGFMHEDSNNGNIAFDVAWRRPGLGLFYGEFLLDDLESPSSLITKDYNQNKWGALAGAHIPFNVGSGQGGVVAEVTRIEPWVYTHFNDFPAQATNLDRPLGNPLGPNVLDLRSRLYYRMDARVLTYVGMTVAATWKGTGPGSNAMDTYDPAISLQTKQFLQGADGPDWLFEPMASVGWKSLTAQAAWGFAQHPRGYARIMIRY
ncbi:MAG: hypothetical protein JWO30_953 [Fibrobacteres bacterium]|nr:hypothetical protein [Fibrobacterota bacterium]